MIHLVLISSISLYSGFIPLTMCVVSVLQLKPRERAALNYGEALKEKYASHPQIKRIARHRHVPKHVYNAQQELRTIKNKTKRKESNRRAHSKKGEVPRVAERQRHVVREDA